MDNHHYMLWSIVLVWISWICFVKSSLSGKECEVKANFRRPSSPDNDFHLKTLRLIQQHKVLEVHIFNFFNFGYPPHFESENLSLLDNRGLEREWSELWKTWKASQPWTAKASQRSMQKKRAFNNKFTNKVGNLSKMKIILDVSSTDVQLLMLNQQII